MLTREMRELFPDASKEEILEVYRLESLKSVQVIQKQSGMTKNHVWIYSCIVFALCFTSGFYIFIQSAFAERSSPGVIGPPFLQPQPRDPREESFRKHLEETRYKVDGQSPGSEYIEKFAEFIEEHGIAVEPRIFNDSLEHPSPDNHSALSPLPAQNQEKATPSRNDTAIRFSLPRPPIEFHSLVVSTTPGTYTWERSLSVAHSRNGRLPTVAEVRRYLQERCFVPVFLFEAWWACADEVSCWVRVGELPGTPHHLGQTFKSIHDRAPVWSHTDEVKTLRRSLAVMQPSPLTHRMYIRIYIFIYVYVFIIFIFVFIFVFIFKYGIYICQV